jgi:hypothetical protein
MVKGVCAASARLIFGTVISATLSGCGHIPIWINGKYYGLSSDVVAAQPVMVTRSPPPRLKSLPKPQKPRRPQAQIDLAESRELDQLYQKLTLLIPQDAQWDLAQEQYAWRNRLTILCDEGGTFDAQCGDEITSERIAELSARVDALSQLASPVPGGAASPQLSPSAPKGAASPRAPPSVPEGAASPPLPPSVPEGAASPVVAAHAVTYTVAATAMPWVWKAGGLNASFQYGLQDGSPPTVVALGPDAQAGQYVTIKYVAGQIALGAGGPKADGLGYAGQKDHGGKGITGQKLPSSFMRPYPINLGSLVGVFTDQKGGIVGAPFAIGDGAVSKQVPPGARQIQLGVNDDIYGGADAATGNSGSFTVAVSPGRS